MLRFLKSVSNKKKIQSDKVEAAEHRRRISEQRIDQVHQQLIAALDGLKPKQKGNDSV